MTTRTPGQHRARARRRAPWSGVGRLRWLPTWGVLWVMVFARTDLRRLECLETIRMRHPDADRLAAYLPAPVRDR